jgi:hypothetical protein
MVRFPAILATLLILGSLSAAVPLAAACESVPGALDTRCDAAGTPTRVTAGGGTTPAGATVFVEDAYYFPGMTIFRTGALVYAGPAGAAVVRDCADYGPDGTCDENTYFVTNSAGGLMLRGSSSSMQVCRFVPAAGGCTTLPVGMPALP